MKALPLSLAIAAALLAPPTLHAQDATPPAQPGPDAALPDLADAPKLPETPHAAWHADYQAALALAKEQKKHLLIVFTGSDWIPLCRIYDRDILNQPEFIDAVSEHYVLVRMDYPKKTPQPPAVVQQNQLFMRAYRVSGFPTLMVTDLEGRPYGVNGYQPVTPANYAKVIGAMRQSATIRDQYFEKAAAASGTEKASLLAKGVPNLPGNLSARYYRAQLEEIIANDPKDETGKAAKCKRLLADVVYSDRMQELESKVEWGEMLTTTDAYIAENGLQGAERQQALLNKASVYQKQGKLADLIRTLLEIVAIDAKTPQAQQAQGALDKLRAKKLQEELSPGR